MLGAILFGAKNGLLMSGGYWGELFKESFGNNSFLAALVKESFKYLDPGFYPSREESLTLLNAAIEELNKLEHTRSRA